MRTSQTGRSPLPASLRPSTAAARATLVLADIHMRTAMVDEILAALAGRYDRVVLMGDYFDRPPGARGKAVTAEEAESLVAWLRNSLAQPNRTHLVGNHDLSYFAPSHDTLCSGENAATMEAISRGLPRSDIRCFKAAIRVGPWVISHAGFQPPLLAGRDIRRLVPAANAGLASIYNTRRGIPQLLACGYARGGEYPYGGVTWCDWDCEFQPSVGLHQVVGHTCELGLVRGKHLHLPEQLPIEENVEIPPGGEECRRLDLHSSNNWCIDTALEVVALLEPNQIRFVRWRKPT